MKQFDCEFTQFEFILNFVFYLHRSSAAHDLSLPSTSKPSTSIPSSSSSSSKSWIFNKKVCKRAVKVVFNPDDTVTCVGSFEKKKP